MRQIRVVILAVAMVACGGKSNTAVTDNGVTLSPKSGIAVVALADNIIPVTEVIVSDASNLCAQIPTSSCGETASFGSGLVSLTALVLEVTTDQPGSYPVSDPTATFPDGGGSFSGLGAVVEFISENTAGTQVQDLAVSGTLKLDSATINGSASGSYDVVMKSGSHLQGDFTGDNCPAFTAELTSEGSDTVNCSAPGSSQTSCSTSCTCGGSTVAASCQQEPDGGIWNCNCTSATGAATTCQMPATTFSEEACQQGESCCPLSF